MEITDRMAWDVGPPKSLKLRVFLFHFILGLSFPFGVGGWGCERAGFPSQDWGPEIHRIEIGKIIDLSCCNKLNMSMYNVQKITPRILSV